MTERRPTARLEGDMIHIEVPIEVAQSLRIALQPCPCRNTKSTKSAAIRDRFVRGIGMAMFREPGETHNA